MKSLNLKALNYEFKPPKVQESLNSPSTVMQIKQRLFVIKDTLEPKKSSNLLYGMISMCWINSPRRWIMGY